MFTRVMEYETTYSIGQPVHTDHLVSSYSKNLVTIYRGEISDAGRNAGWVEIIPLAELVVRDDREDAQEGRNRHQDCLESR